MRDFFNGWRRKIGVVTLLMACLLLAGWMRSLKTWEVICVRHLYIYSFNQELTLIYGHDDREYSYNSAELSVEDRKSFWSYTKVNWWIGVPGVYVGQGNNSNKANDAITFALIHYWSLVLPLTAISAFFLLTKPRQSNPEKTTEHFPPKLD